VNVAFEQADTAGFDRVLTWPSKGQEVAVRVLSEMEEQDASPYRLTNEQVKEVERRRADFAPAESVTPPMMRWPRFGRNATYEKSALFFPRCRRAAW
jgi:hypothetical protein